MHIASAIQTLELLDLDTFDFSNLEREIAVRTAAFLDQEVVLFYSGLGPRRHNQRENRPFLRVSSDGSKPSIVWQDDPVLTDMSGSSCFRRSIFLPRLDDRGWLQSSVVLELSHNPGDEYIRATESFIDRLTSSAVQKICATIRRAVIKAKTESDDINSFLHRALHKFEIPRLCGAEACSIFVLDPIGQLVRMRQSTGLRNTERRLSDIYFHPGMASRVYKVYADGEPKFEYDPTGDLHIGASAEHVQGGRLYSKVYWPLSLRAKESDGVTDQCAAAGVIRLVNSVREGKCVYPFTTLQGAAISFAAESIFNVVDFFLGLEEASFKKDEAFHNSSSVVDTISKNVNLVRKSIIKHDSENLGHTIPQQFELSPVSSRTVDPVWIKRLLDTAYASSRDLAYQIERANMSLPATDPGVTRHLIKDVLLRALELIPDMMIAHSARERLRIPAPREFFTDTLPPPVRGSEALLMSVFANIFENAVKYRKVNKLLRIDVAITTTEHDVILRVRDYGVGVENGEEERVFRRGYRTRRARNFHPRGNGLGLFWCRQVLDLVGSEIFLTRRDPGTEVTVKLRRAKEKL